MSDARLRELERAWRSSKSVVDEQAYLLERVRIGDLSEERFLLAAHLGHEASRLAVGPNTGPTDFPWATGLLGFGRTLRFGSVSFFNPGLWPVFVDGEWPTMDEVRTIRRELADEPATVFVEQGQEAGIRAGFAVLHHVPGLVDPGHRRGLEQIAVAFVLNAVPVEWFTSYERRFPLSAAGFVSPRQTGNKYPWLGHIQRAVARLGEAEVQRVIAEDLLPWVFGTGDPLRDYVEANGFTRDTDD